MGSSLDSATSSPGDSWQAPPSLALLGLCFLPQLNKTLSKREGDLEAVPRKGRSLANWRALS